ncbi:class I SAM-dependent methyltransferase family protein [Candidatus Bathyarchaeota archaeon]|nr:class I SAM-dependent methyltransferase family protein [Candidatus Bathyarchaeota archaeon]
MKGNLKAILRGKLSPEELALVYKSYDIIGDIAIIQVPDKLLPLNETIAEALMRQHKHVKAVWRQSSPVFGDFRLRKLEWIAGKKKTETVYKEHGCLLKVDVGKCYFSPRLGFERMRIANLVRDNEVVVNMFAGVGCYSVIIARHSKAAKIYSIDINPVAVKYMRENVLLNKMVNTVIPIEGDAGTTIEEMLKNIADRILMPLPEKAYKYIDSAFLAVKLQGGWIHYYSFEHAKKEENPIEKAKTQVGEKLKQQNVNFELPFGRIVRQTGPNWYQIAIDIQVKK